MHFHTFIFYYLLTCIFNHTFYSCVCFKTGMFTISELRYHFCLIFMSLRIHQPDFCPGIIHYISQPARLKLAGLFRENNPARQVNQPVFNQSHIIEIIVGQTSIIAELYLKIDFPLNEPVSSQPVSYNNQVLRFGLEKNFFAEIETARCYAYGCSNCSSSSSKISFHRLHLFYKQLKI